MPFTSAESEERDRAQKVASLQRGILHALAPAPMFVGRRKELETLRAFWENIDSTKVMALLGLGGAGKTAIASQFLKDLLHQGSPLPDGLFVWSFYVDQDVTNFLRAASSYFSQGEEFVGSGATLLYRLVDLCATGGRHLIILDGLERVQRTHDDQYGAFGELEDALLRQVLTRLAVGVGQTRCLITSRFPISDLETWRGSGYRDLKIDQLERADARLLLQRHGIHGDERRLDEVIDKFGSHSLTLDYLAVYLAEFCNGDPERAPHLTEPSIESDIREERILARVLHAYDTALTHQELHLIMRFCIFRFGVTVETLHNLFQLNANHPDIVGPLSGLTYNEVEQLVQRLSKLHLLVQESPLTYTAHPAVRDHFYRLFTNTADVHTAVGQTYRNVLALDLIDHWHRLLNLESRISRTKRFKRDVSAIRRLCKELNLFLRKYETKLTQNTIIQIQQCIHSYRFGQKTPLPELELQPEVTKLALRPGGEALTHPDQLDMMEELIYHCVCAGNVEEAYELYTNRMGGRDHLGKQLGECARGVRILRYFPECPNDLDLAWYLRGVGDLQAAFDFMIVQHRFWAGPIVCLQGYLPRMINEKIGWVQSRSIASFLTGETNGQVLMSRLGWGEAMIGADLYLLKGDLEQARILCDEKTYVHYSVPDHVRGELVLAEVERKSGDLAAAQTKLDSVAPWIIRSGSIEHLCYFQIIRTRMMLDQKQYADALSESHEGMLLARRCGFNLYHIDFMNLRGLIYFQWSRELAVSQQQEQASQMLEEAESHALGALNGVLREDNSISPDPFPPLITLAAMGSMHEECQYVWGSIEALCLLGEIYDAKSNPVETTSYFQAALQLQQQVHHPDLYRTLQRCKVSMGE